MKSSLLSPVAPPPVHFGPVWEETPGWEEGMDEADRYVLPTLTLGWHILSWIKDNLLDEEGDSFTPTAEQARFILWMYAVDERGRFLFRDIVLQRLKGWGKDPLAAVLAAVEFVGPCQFSHWHQGAEDIDLGVMEGDPVGRRHSRAWVQVAAVSQTQTRNTMSMFAAMFTPLCKATHGIDIGKEIIYAYGGAAQIQAVTSNPRTMEGNRPTFVILNEALALDTPILRHDGWTTVGNLKDGDAIYGSSGGLTRVTKVHEIQYDRACYRVSLSNGESIVASDGHLWTTRVAESAAKPKVRTTEEMLKDGRKFMVPRGGPLLHPDAELPLDPYVLGYWLGDGSKGACNVTIGDQDVVETIEEFAKRGLPLRPLKRGEHRAGRFGFSNRDGFGGKMGTEAAKALRALPCFRRKHVPRFYYNASVEQRIELLRGLMDSDGCASGTQAIFVGNQQLAEDVYELASGLGFLPYIRRVEDERSRDGATWRVQFVAEGLNPFSMPRKADAIQVKERREWVSIKAIVPVDSVPVRCISVSAEDELFQAGMGVVTHNTHHWLETNNGWEMNKVIKRNLRKSKGGRARSLSITNAYNPSESSVAQTRRETWEDQESGLAIKTGVLYDSLEAHRDAVLQLPRLKDENDIEYETDEEYETRVRDYLTQVILGVRGDAWWLEPEELVAGILDGETTISDARRFYYNQIFTVEDAWLDNDAIQAAIDPLAVAARQIDRDDAIRAGWIIRPEEEIVMFFDGSKSRDSTALVGCRISDGAVFTFGVWSPPKGAAAAKRWKSPRGEVNARVREIFTKFNVVAFFGDPSHARDDDESSEGTAYWDALIDEWHRTYKDKLLLWAVQSGHGQHSIMWDMSNPTHQIAFVKAAELFSEEIQTKNDVEQFVPAFTIDGHPSLLKHLRNAKGYEHPKGYGTSLWKGSRRSSAHIDLAVAAVGARMLRRAYLNRDPDEKRKAAGKVWSYD